MCRDDQRNGSLDRLMTDLAGKTIINCPNLIIALLFSFDYFGVPGMYLSKKNQEMLFFLSSECLVRIESANCTLFHYHQAIL